MPQDAPGKPGPLFEPPKAGRDPQRLCEGALSVGKFEEVDDVNEQ